jgi:flagellar hook protein FlgE
MPVGDNKYFATEESGIPKYIPNTTVIKSEILEVSNSDLAQSLVNLMVFQRSFEASSKAITTSDEFLQTAINLKK